VFRRFMAETDNLRARSFRLQQGVVEYSGQIRRGGECLSSKSGSVKNCRFCDGQGLRGIHCGDPRLLAGVAGPAVFLSRLIVRIQPDVWHIAVYLGIVHPVADHEAVGDFESNIVGFNGYQTSIRLVETGCDLERSGLVLQH